MALLAYSLCSLLLQQGGGSDNELPGKINLNYNSLPMLLFVAGAFIVFGILIWLAARHNRKREIRAGAPITGGSEEIFTRLCEVNGLARSEANTLRRLVFDLKLGNPLLPFVDPTTFDRYAQAEGRGMQVALSKIREKLFA